MKTPFTTPAESYAGEEPDTPYRRARQEWDRRMGAAMMSARTWQVLTLISAALAAIAFVGLVTVAMQQRTFVHVVEVSPEGQVMSVRAADGRWTPTQAQIAHHLGRFVVLVRSLPTDEVVLRSNWLEAYKFLTRRAAAQLNEIARQNDPFSALDGSGERSRSDASSFAPTDLGK